MEIIVIITIAIAVYLSGRVAWYVSPRTGTWLGIFAMLMVIIALGLAL